VFCFSGDLVFSYMSKPTNMTGSMDQASGKTLNPESQAFMSQRLHLGKYGYQMHKRKKFIMQ
jgi:hypothetical protein